jgi:hypothetical protein
MLDLQEIQQDIEKFFSSNHCSFGSELINALLASRNKLGNSPSFFDVESLIGSTYTDYLLMRHCQNNKNLFLIIVWPVTRSPDEILYETYSKYGAILYKKEIFLENRGFKNILNFIGDKKSHPWGSDLWFAEPHRHERPLKVYVFEANQSIASEEDQFRYLVKIFGNNTQHILGIKNRGGLNNLYATTKAKRECRDLLAKNGLVSPVKLVQDRQYSHHVNDEHEETTTLSRIFFNRNSIYAVNHWDPTFNPQSFNDKFPRYKKFLNNNQFGGLEDFCINNSSVMSQFGIRDSRDIDYMHNEKFNIPKQFPEEEISSHNYVIKDTDPNIKIDDIVYDPRNHFWLNDIKFSTLSQLLKFKRLQSSKGNAKARNDEILINKFLK